MNSTILSLLSAQSIQEFYQQGFWRGETIYAVARSHAEHMPDKPAVRDRFRRLTFHQLIGAANALAGDLQRRGVRPSQRVTFWMPDRIESVVALLACSRNGYVCCPSPHRNHTVDEVVTLMERMRSTILIHQTGFGADADHNNIENALDGLGSLRHIYNLAPAGTDTSLPFAGVSESSSGELVEPISDPDRVSYLAFTSGSTGRPKGVMHSDNTQLVTARAISRDWHVDAKATVYSLSPFSHNLGMGSLLTSLVGGAEFVIHDLDRRTESLVDRLEETGVTYLVGVPTHAMDLLAEMRERNLATLGRVKGFRISGAATPKTVFAELMANGVVPQSGYGMTETNAHQYTRPDDDIALIMDSCGRVCEGYEIRILDPNNPDHELPLGEIGLVAGRGACLMLGYFDDQVSTEASFNALGWFMTGDLGWIDENGYLRLTGRKKEVIIRGGHNINPERIEELAMRNDCIERAAAVAVADERLGEKVCLAVMFLPGKRTTFEAVLDHLARQGLSRYDMPEFGLELDHIPLMSNGKIQKSDILTWIAEGRVAPAPVSAGKAQSVET
ncbi:MAG: acyl--CoA ligase [Rhodospirillaceae bacterium]|jgi:acyl-CoA synthetase (AMP-forming)/AMP-acid ligase II|nr:acyl--CoA ligase [Rhodospirillaceae bacterium]